MRLIKNVVLVLSTGYIFVFFSEHLFWARVRPGDSLAGWAGAWIAYSLLAFVFLSLVTKFHIKTIWPLFLAGAAFGWLAEGVIVQTTYESLPLSISFTGLAWHALITVWIGWYGLQKSFASPDPLSTLKLSALIGICYGLWAICWWVEPDGGVATLAEFARYSMLTTILVVIAYYLAHWSLSEAFMPGRLVKIMVSAVFILYFLFVTVPASPLAAVILPVLLGLVFLGLSRNRQTVQEGSVLDQFNKPVRLWKIMSILILPAAGILVYGIAMAWNLQWYTNWVLYAVATPLGFILFGMSLYKTLQH
jgi:hypothetical protein